MHATKFAECFKYLNIYYQLQILFGTL